MADLITQLGYPTTPEEMTERLEQILTRAEYNTFVAETGAKIVGMLGVGLLTAILGRRPNPAAAVVLGAAYGIAVEAILINGIVNTQKIQTLYSSTPHWSWWVGHAIFGMTLGLLASVLLSRNDRRAG